MTWKMVDAAAMVREIAAMDPESTDPDEYVFKCHFCRLVSVRREQAAHSSDCLWVRCNALVKEMDG